MSFAKTAGKVLRVLLIGVGVVIGCVVSICGLAVVGWLLDSRQASKIASRFQSGMTIEQFVAALPTDEFWAHISVPSRTQPCKSETGQIVPVETFAGYWPDFSGEDYEVADEARQFPMRLPPMELLDKRLRERSDWNDLVRVWSIYLENVEDPGPIPYYRRGTVYLAAGDFNIGYADLKKSCKLGLKEACAEIKKLPRDKVAAFDTQEERIAATASACEPELHNYDLFPSHLKPEPEATKSIPASANAAPFQLIVHQGGQLEPPQAQSISRPELAELLAREYQGREWYISFRVDGHWDGMRSYMFRFTVDRNGKLKTTDEIRIWDR